MSFGLKSMIGEDRGFQNLKQKPKQKPNLENATYFRKMLQT